MKLPIIMLAGASMLATLPAQSREEIPHEQNRAYVWDTQGYIVRDRYDRCVRSIHWTKEKAIAKCEGWAKPTPKVAVPAPAPVKPEPWPIQPPALPENPHAQPVAVAPEMPEGPVHFNGFFATNKDTFNPSKLDKIHAQLNDYVDYLKAHPAKRVKISGHTDNRGTHAHNLDLSQRRANTVKNYLIANGISADRIDAKGYSYDKPIAGNDTDEGRALNRRVEMDLID